MKNIVLITLFGFLLFVPLMTTGITAQQVTEENSMATEWWEASGVCSIQ